MAVDKSEKKRKRASEKHERPSKKSAIAPVAPPLKVDFAHNRDGAAPVIASTPGVNLSASVSLDAYTKPRAKRNKSVTENAGVASSELLLHSSSHPRLDFTGKEAENDLDNLWDHYVAVYDPEAGTLQLTEARKMTVRACIRQPSPEVEEDTEGETTVPSSFSQRNALAETFGTKQSKKAVQSMQNNALVSGASGEAPGAAESALLSSMPQDQVASSPQKSAQEEIQAAKPLPQPNLSANQPSEVYSIESLVPNGYSTLRQMPTAEWEEALAASEPVTTSSRFVSNRIEIVGRSEDKTHLQILRFIIMLLELAKSLKPGRSGPNSKAAGPGSKKLPQREDLRQILSSTTGSQGIESTAPMANITDSLLENIRRKFAPQGSFLSKNDITFLHTTICALSLHIPPEGGFRPNELATDPANLRDDLRLENQVITQYFRELGCRIDKPKESEYAQWGIKKGKAEAGAMRIVRLRLPLEFPKLSRGGGRRK